MSAPTVDAGGLVDSRPTADAARTVDRETYRRAFRAHAAAVVVITTDVGDGPVGFTATSLVSVSLDPPLVSFALSTSSSSWPPISRATTVVVNFLDAGQHQLATTFATSGIDRFAGVAVLPAGGDPLLAEAPAHLRAEIVDRLPAGDHGLVLAHVTSAHTSRPYSPLLYHHGSYHTLARPDSQETPR